MGQGKLDVKTHRGNLVKPELWNKLISRKSTRLIDVRNVYEIKIGKFKNAINQIQKIFVSFLIL